MQSRQSNPDRNIRRNHKFGNRSNINNRDHRPVRFSNSDRNLNLSPDRKCVRKLNHNNRSSNLNPGRENRTEGMTINKTKSSMTNK